MGINVGQRGLAETGMVESDPNELRGGGGTLAGLFSTTHKTVHVTYL
jgi:hypothetical protein